MKRSLLIELIYYTKNTLDSVKKISQLSRGKFSDKEFGEFFYRMITKDIEKNDLVLNSFLNYIKATTPIKKRGTVNTLIEEVLKEYQGRLDENKTKVFRNFEKDLPETIVPDDQLKYTLDSMLQYIVAEIPADGSVEFLTKTIILQKETREDQSVFKKNGKYIEISVVITYSKELKEQPILQEEVVTDLILRLVDDIVERNQGMIRFELDETRAKRTISLKFPIERRNVVRYD